MMLLVFSILPFAALVLGGPLLGRNPKGNCNVGKMQCCDNVSTPNSPDVLNSVTSPSVLNLLASLPVDAPIGMGCTSAGAGSGAGCNANPICCESNAYQVGLINVGCVPMNLSEL